MRKIRWYDWLVYRLFFRRWNKILSERPDLREFMISSLKAFDTLDKGDKVKVTVSFEKINEKV